LLNFCDLRIAEQYGRHKETFALTTMHIYARLLPFLPEGFKECISNDLKPAARDEDSCASIPQDGSEAISSWNELLRTSIARRVLI
jgi:hypothetical protein